MPYLLNLNLPPPMPPPPSTPAHAARSQSTGQRKVYSCKETVCPGTAPFKTRLTCSEAINDSHSHFLVSFGGKKTLDTRFAFPVFPKPSEKVGPSELLFVGIESTPPWTVYLIGGGNTLYFGSKAYPIRKAFLSRCVGVEGQGGLVWLLSMVHIALH